MRKGTGMRKTGLAAMAAGMVMLAGCGAYGEANDNKARRSRTTTCSSAGSDSSPRRITRASCTRASTATGST